MPNGLRELRVRTEIQCQHGCGETGRYTYSGEVISADPMRVAFGQTGRISAQLSNAKVEAQGLTSPSGSHGALAACCATLSREAFHNRSLLWCSGGLTACASCVSALKFNASMGVGRLEGTPTQEKSSLQIQCELPLARLGASLRSSPTLRLKHKD